MPRSSLSTSEASTFFDRAANRRRLALRQSHQDLHAAQEPSDILLSMEKTRIINGCNDDGCVCNTDDEDAFFAELDDAMLQHLVEVEQEAQSLSRQELSALEISAVVADQIDALRTAQADELNRLMWVPVGIATGLSMLLGVMAACGLVDQQVAAAGLAADMTWAGGVLYYRDSFRKIFCQEKIELLQEIITEKLRADPGNLLLRAQAEEAGVYYNELE